LPDAPRTEVLIEPATYTSSVKDSNEIFEDMAISCLPMLPMLQIIGDFILAPCRALKKTKTPQISFYSNIYTAIESIDVHSNKEIFSYMWIKIG